jgi:hypothetical protein
MMMALLALCLYTSWVWAGTNDGRISLNVGVDFATDYYFRGIIQETDDSIIQPYGEIGLKLYEGAPGSGLNSITGVLGMWNSFHGGDTGADGSATTDPKFWYESDLYAGVAIGFADLFEFGISYILYTSPNSSFSDVGEWDFSLSFDDSGLLGPFALSPSITLAFEVDGQADGGTDEGVYLQLGVEPSYTLIEQPQLTVGVAVPLTLGLSLDDYYEDANGGDDGFGYFDAGVAVNVGLGAVPKSFGEVSVTVAGHFLFLGDNLEEANNGDAFKAIGSIGVSLAY